MLNSCQIQGRLATEPELNTSGSTQVVRFTLETMHNSFTLISRKLLYCKREIIPFIILF